jgi:hypothetical protein
VPTSEGVGHLSSQVILYLKRIPRNSVLLCIVFDLHDLRILSAQSGFGPVMLSEGRMYVVNDSENKWRGSIVRIASKNSSRCRDNEVYIIALIDLLGTIGE